MTSPTTAAAPSPAPETRELQAEIKQLLDLMVHSLYSNQDVFLRELVSNASDALDKRRFAQLTDTSVGGDDELAIRLELDEAARTLAVIDNGIGMTRDEAARNLGTIARSGTKEFLQSLREASAAAAGGGPVPPELIGRFGVGFYAAFMVADRVEVVTRRAGTAEVTRWVSTGDGSFTLTSLDAGERPGPGTTVTLHLKPADEEHGVRDYAQEHVVRDIVRRYSDFVGYPIRTVRHNAAEGAPATPSEPINSMRAIWDRSKGEVSDAEYQEFYRHVSHDWAPPLRTVPVKMEGTVEANALLFVPSKAPFDLYSPEMKRGVQLYVRRVFIMDECKDLMPSWLRFVRGVVDAHDLSLNVSRELLQRDRQIAVIRKQLVKKVLGSLDELRQGDLAAYRGFWTELGPVLKEGLVAPDGGDARDKLLDLVLATSTAGAEPTTLAEYVGRMKDGQDAIYVLSGASASQVAASPLLEGFRARGLEVLLFSDPIDEIWLDNQPTYQGKPLRAIDRADVPVGPAAEQADAAAKLDDQRRELGDLLTALRVHLQDQIKEVRLTNRLTTSAACLVSDERDPNPRMMKILEQFGQKPEPVKRILEINPEHPAVRGLHAVFAASSTDPRLPLMARLLMGQAQLAEGTALTDPTAFRAALDELMTRAVG